MLQSAPPQGSTSLCLLCDLPLFMELIGSVVGAGGDVLGHRHLLHKHASRVVRWPLLHLWPVVDQRTGAAAVTNDVFNRPSLGALVVEAHFDPPV